MQDDQYIKIGLIIYTNRTHKLFYSTHSTSILGHHLGIILGTIQNRDC